MDLLGWRSARNKRVRELKFRKKYTIEHISATLGIEVSLIKKILHQSVKVKEPKKHGNRFYDIRMKEWS